MQNSTFSDPLTSTATSLSPTKLGMVIDNLGHILVFLKCFGTVCIVLLLVATEIFGQLEPLN